MSARADNPDRKNFHAWLVTQGYRADIKPLGSTYASSHVQSLWECWKAAIASKEPS